jgi:signal transduction histidine kinase
METMPQRRTYPYWMADGIIAAGLALISVFQLAWSNEAVQDLFRREPDGWAYLLALAQTLPLTFRRIRPIPVLFIVAGSFMIDRGLDYPSTIAVTGVLFAFHAIGSELPRRQSLVIGLSTAGVLTLFTLSGVAYNESVEFGTVILVLIGSILPLFLGREVHERRRYLTELEARTKLLERDREERARRAVREERARIARELHDVVAHEMTVMTIQAAAASRVLDSNPSQAAEALTAIEAAGHDALAEMRRLLGLLRTDEQPANRSPQPGLQRLDGLVEQMVEAGLSIEVIVEGTPRPLPAGIDLNAYRIIQESLTNTLKHGGPDVSAQVHLEFTDQELGIEVTDDGRGAAEALSADDGGHGLLGMQERIALLNGDFSSGPRGGGGYRVAARIPVPV